LAQAILAQGILRTSWALKAEGQAIVRV